MEECTLPSAPEGRPGHHLFFQTQGTALALAFFPFFFPPSKKGGENKIKMIHHSAGKGEREGKKRAWLNTVAISCFHLANFIPGFYVR